ncbi:MAG TPA: hypothetical protein VFO49_09350 [Nocardioides sp.]|nr:hypothetical protein [Nocardioides sp.]
MTHYADTPTSPGAPARTGVRASSVPSILLGLGALCLLVAAVIFLSVAWSRLGVGGRTGVLVGLTIASGGCGLLAAHRGLRVAGEALTVVALGLVALDVLGADAAGWWGRLGVAELVLLVGGVVALASLALAAAPARLIAPQIVAGYAALLTYAGALGVADRDPLVDTAAVALLAAVSWTSRRTGRDVLAAIAGVAAGVPWVHLTLDALERGLQDPTLHAVWAGPGEALVVAAALALVPVGLGVREQLLVVGLGGIAATLATIAVGLPAVDEGATVATSASLVALVGWTAVGLGTPRPWRGLPLVAAGAAAVPVFAVVLALCVQAGLAGLTVGPVFSEDFDVPLGPVDPVAAPWLLIAGLAALVALVSVAARPSARGWSIAAVATVAVSGIATLALFPVPLAVPLAALVGVALVLLAADERLAACAVLLVVVVAALPSAVLTGVAATLLLAAAATCLGAGRALEDRLLGGALVPPAAAVAVWAFAEVAGVEESLRGYPVLLAVGLLALALPRPEVEASAWVAGLVAAPAACLAAADPVTATAVHLTVAGGLVVAGSLVHPQRRALGWVGGLLLAAATWVRLADLGVEAPEAYTLPSALALLVVGLDRLRRDPEAATATALTPGLLLATVPSLLWCLDDPVTWRAAWLGAACVGLVLAGALLRWHAPLVVGAAVGGVLVVRELAPYAAQTPQWILIGAAGALLTVVGVTWEHRLAQVRQAAAYLERLR